MHEAVSLRVDRERMAQEIEIKLAVEPEQAQRLWTVLARHPHGRPARPIPIHSHCHHGGAALRLALTMRRLSSSSSL